MLQELVQHSEAVGLKKNMSKTKVMFNEYCQQQVIRVNSNEIEAVTKYVHLGHLLEKNHSIKEELHCYTRAGWAAYNRLSNILESKPIPMILKRKAFNQCIIPTMTYATETWSLTKAQATQLQTAQQQMESKMLGIRLKDRKTNLWIRQWTRVKEVVAESKRMKWRWAGHVIRQSDGRWIERTTSWLPRDGKRK